jgi:predicted Zn finger-like uncharacterized protein
MAAPLTLQQLSHKLRIIKPKPGGQDLPPTKAYTTTRVTALDNGLNLNRQDGGLIQYPDISLMVAFQLDTDPDTWYVDLFVYRQPAPFRLSQKVINYRQFLPKVSQRSKDNFYTFLLYLIDRTDSVYVDEHTLEFLKNQKMTGFPDFSLFESYTRQLWFQIVSWMKFQCDQCNELYWVDDAKISEQGAKTKCVKCQNLITVKKRTPPQPIKAPQEPQDTITCPHCQYENKKGAQFCVLCQQPLSPVRKPKQSAASRPRSAEPRASEAGRPKASAKSSPAAPPPAAEKAQTPPEQVEAPPSMEAMLEMDGVPLQARGQRKPRLTFREIEEALEDDLNSMENKFAWFSQFSRIMQVLGFVFLIGGLLVGVYIYTVIPGIPSGQRLPLAGLAAAAGFLLSLASIIVSNIIALTLQIERNTKVTTILLQKLFEKESYTR